MEASGIRMLMIFDRVVPAFLTGVAEDMTRVSVDWPTLTFHYPFLLNQDFLGLVQQ